MVWDKTLFTTKIKDYDLWRPLSRTPFENNPPLIADIKILDIYYIKN